MSVQGKDTTRVNNNVTQHFEIAEWANLNTQQLFTHINKPGNALQQAAVSDVSQWANLADGNPGKCTSRFEIPPQMSLKGTESSANLFGGEQTVKSMANRSDMSKFTMMATETKSKLGFRASMKQFFLGEKVVEAPVRAGTLPTLFPPTDVNWSRKEIKQARQFAMRHIDVRRKQAPGMHTFEYDFSKNYKDPIEERPGIDFSLDPKIKVEMAKGVDPNLVEFGKKQTPINLSSKMEIKEDFQDREFEFAYDKVDRNQKSLKFNQVGDAYYFDLAKGRDEKKNTNFMKTSTISLFDEHIPAATLHGAQFHFHAPSEHSIDGHLLDLEMHIVHLMEEKHDPSTCSCCNQKERVEKGVSQFGAGVLGFFFKVMPEEYFEEMKMRYPQVDMDWHDNFMLDLVKKENERQAAGAPDEDGLDLTEFVEKVNFNKRWTYQGSLTTAPCDEGILWNVVENVIPIRQSTLDLYTEMRKVEEEQIANKIEDTDKATLDFLEEVKETIPESVASKKEGGNTFMRIGGCNRKVQDENGRAVYRIDLQD